MVRGRNIARTEVLVELAGELRERSGERFDVDLFIKSMAAPRTKTAVLSDMRDAHDSGITRFPTLRFKQAGAEPLVVTGYRSPRHPTSWGEPTPR